VQERSINKRLTESRFVRCTDIHASPSFRLTLEHVLIFAFRQRPVRPPSHFRNVSGLQYDPVQTH